MRILPFITITTTTTLILALPTLSNARFIIPFSPLDTISQKLRSRLPSSSSSPSQQVLMKSNDLRSASSNCEDNDHNNNIIITNENTSPLLSDIIGKNREISIFSSLTRDVEPAASLLEDPSRNATILAPLNTAVQQLPHKPWEDERDYSELGIEKEEEKEEKHEEVYAGAAGSARAERNLERFVLRHIVPGSPWREEGEKGKMRTLSDGGGDGGKEVWWTRKKGKLYIQPDDIEVVTISKSVHNGEVWIIRDVLK